MRRLDPWALAFVAASSLAAVACGGDATCEGCGGAGSTTTTSTSSCTSATGTLHGKVTTSDGTAAARATIELRHAAADTPLQAKADDAGSYSVDLDAGSWIVAGVSEDGYCSPTTPGTVDLAACGDVEHDFVLDACVL